MCGQQPQQILQLRRKNHKNFHFVNILANCTIVLRIIQPQPRKGVTITSISLGLRRRQREREMLICNYKTTPCIRGLTDLQTNCVCDD